MEFDVPWEVRFDKDFWDTAEELKESGSWENVKNKILKVIENPARTGRYKDGTLKGCKTTHIGEKVIGWQVKPGVNAELQEEVEEVCFLFIVHHDEQGVGNTQFDPVKQSSEFEISLPYYGGFEMEKKIYQIYQQAKQTDGLRVSGHDWRAEEVLVTGIVPPDARDKLESVIPNSVEIEYDDPELFE